MDGEVCTEFNTKVAKALRSAAFHLRRHFSLFCTARALHTFGFSKISLMLDGPYEYEKVFKVIKAEARKHFYDGNGASIRWDLLTLPRHLGGLGLIDPILANEASFARQLCTILVGNDENLRGIILSLMALEYQNICGCPLRAFIAKPVKTVAKVVTGHESFSRRCLFAFQLFGLGFSLPPSPATADAAEIVLLPFHNPSYPFNLSGLARADDWDSCVASLRAFGICSFLDLLWQDTSLGVDDGTSSSKLRRFQRLQIRPPRLEEVRRKFVHTTLRSSSSMTRVVVGGSYQPRCSPFTKIGLDCSKPGQMLWLTSFADSSRLTRTSKCSLTLQLI